MKKSSYLSMKKILTTAVMALVVLPYLCESQCPSSFRGAEVACNPHSLLFASVSSSQPPIISLGVASLSPSRSLDLVASLISLWHHSNDSSALVHLIPSSSLLLPLLNNLNIRYHCFHLPSVLNPGSFPLH